jgi:hypothetical protein
MIVDYAGSVTIMRASSLGLPASGSSVEVEVEVVDV